MIKLVSGCCQSQLLVHVPIRQTHRAVQVQELRFGLQLERHGWIRVRSLFPLMRGGKLKTCRLLIQQVEQEQPDWTQLGQTERSLRMNGIS